MNKKERKELYNMKIMVEGFGEIAKICEYTVLDLPFRRREIEDRYYKILDVLQYVTDNLKN